MLDGWIWQSIYLQSEGCLTVKAAKAFINVSDVSYKKCTLLWYTKKEHIDSQIICLLPQKKCFLGLPNLGTQIRCAQNWYTTVQTESKIPPAMSTYISKEN